MMAAESRSIWLDVMLYAGPGSALSAPSGSASKMLCALFPEQFKKLLTGDVDVQGGIPSADRPRLIGEAEARILALEIGEERLVMAALDAGLEVHAASMHRCGRSCMPPEAAQAEAAE
jgi:hypothetical protein